MPKGFQKDNEYGKGRPLGSKNTVTLLKEERRAIFEEKVSAMFLDTIEKARPEYLLDQFLGKAPDELKVSGELNTTSFTAEQITLLKAKVKDKQTK